MQIVAKQLALKKKVSTWYLVIAYQWWLSEVDVHMAEMYGKYANMQIFVMQNLVVLYVVWGLASSEVFWGVGIIPSLFGVRSSQVFVRAGSRLKLVAETEKAIERN